ncbi:MAG: SPFH domain-containing protein [Pseudomonadota bacterium]
MGTDNLIFLENIEWFDESGKQLVQRIPQQGSGEIKWGAQLTVRESQAAVFVYQGKAVEAFGPGRHTLKTGNIPVLTKIASLPWAMSSPLRAEVYFVNMKTFTNLTWGTRDPVAFKDSELGLIRLRAHGVFNLQVLQPVLFVNRMVGTQGVFSTDTVEEYLNLVIVSRFNDYMGETLDSILNLPSRYDDLAGALARKLQKDFQHFGLNLTHLYMNAITPPPEVQKAIDDTSRMSLFKDMNKFMQMKAAMAMESAAQSDSGAGSGMGMGMGLMMPALFARYFPGQNAGSGQTPGASPEPGSNARAHCPECQAAIPVDSRFCPMCGHQQVIFQQCDQCGKNLTPAAKFCSRCGHPVNGKPQPRVCSRCGATDLSDASYCNQCGEKH